MDEIVEQISATDTRVLFGSEQALPCLAVSTPMFEALISLQGAQLLSFVPSGEADWFWLSPRESFQPGKAIRGGIPLCAPWFGVNRRQPELPSHGYFRNQLWQCRDTQLHDDHVRLTLTCDSRAEDIAVFPWPVSAELTLELGRDIQLSLTLTNRGERLMPLSFAFHSYFACASLPGVRIAQLQGQRYLDNCAGLTEKRRRGALVFGLEVDQVYPGLGGSQTLALGPHSLNVAGDGCDTAVVWNPGPSLAGQLADVDEHYTEFVCLERGMAFDDELALPPGHSHRATMRIGRC